MGRSGGAIRWGDPVGRSGGAIRWGDLVGWRSGGVAIWWGGDLVEAEETRRRDARLVL
ncbi:hypothetical protein ABN034_03095 [Actinopolymorpha sp. B11F2]|uniref:hypothetical protein n=1 Tax=Actinopolymorpha sp. B11F2 TaxID=3160862 RepID=UPI0032E4F13C